MPKFFVLPEQIGEAELYISGEDARHIARSLRMAAGETVAVTDGMGIDYLCKLLRIRDERCDCEILSRFPSAGEPKIPVTLFMAYPKGDKLETIVQKAVELGACRIVPFESSRCVKRPSADRADKILQRLSRIAEEAAKQCGRGVLPLISPTLSFSAAIREAAKHPLALFCYEGSAGDPSRSVRSILDKAEMPASIAVIVGCEGGFSPEEAAEAKSVGLVPVGLGPRILRCETAPSFVLSAICYRYEL